MQGDYIDQYDWNQFFDQLFPGQDIHPGYDPSTSGFFGESFLSLLEILNKYFADQDSDDIDRIFRAQELQDLFIVLQQYDKGEATLEDVKAVDVGLLSEIDSFNGWYNTLVGGSDDDDTSDEDPGLGELDPNADIRQILKDNGYSDEAIEEIFKAEVNNDRFKGNNVLSNALCQIGYSNCSDWSVTAINPNGAPCTTAENERGTYQNGECVANESNGTDVGDRCTIELPFGAGTIEGKYDQNGNCIPLGVNGGGGGGSENDCVVITQENADECGYEITSDGQLVPKDLSGAPDSYPTYVNCGGGIFAKTEADCPEMEGTGDPCDDPENASLPECVEKSFEDYVNEVGEGVANTAKGLYDELGDKITECVGSPIDCIKKIGTAILDAGGIPPECRDMGDGTTCGTAESPTPCWKDCVSFNLPGLPIPNIPLPPGVVDIGTYRDFENAIKTVGHTIGDIIEGNESCGPNGDQECTVGQILEDLGTWAKEKWEDAISGIDDATVDDVLEWLKGILGPVTAGIIWAEIEEEVTNILASYGSENDFDCSTVGKEGGVVQTEDQCGDCLEGYEDIQGQCQEKDDPVTNQGPTAAECAAEHREFIEATDIEDSECGECLAGWRDEEGVCVEDFVTTPLEECEEGEVRRGGLDDGRCVRIGEACFSEPGKYGGDDPTIAQGQINSEGFCTRGGNTETPTEPGTPCDSNGDGNLDGTTDANGNCIPSPPPPPTGCQDPNATNQGSDGPCECPAGYEVSPDGTQCVLIGTPPPPSDECDPRGTVLESGCDGTTFFIRFSSGEIDPNTGECGEIYDSVPNFHECVNNGGVCDDPNAVNNGEEGPCECKPGFSKNAEGLCFQSDETCDNGATIESGCDICPDGTPTIEYEDGKCPTSTPPQDCSDSAYAAANPQLCGGVPPVTPPSSGGGGGGGVGGGVGAFSPFIAGIDYTPQPLPAAPAAPQKDYMAELDSLIKRNLFEGMV